jgi:hypothetical protein
MIVKAHAEMRSIKKMSEMKAYEIAEIIDTEKPEYQGRLVMKVPGFGEYSDRVVCLSNLPEGGYWSDMYQLQVRLLNPGDKVIIEVQ